MRAYFAEDNPVKRDGIAVRQLRALREHQGPRDEKLRLSDVKAMFFEMKRVSNGKAAYFSRLGIICPFRISCVIAPSDRSV